MAVLQRVSLYANERFDIPDARSLEGFALNDWRFFLKGVMAGQSYVIQGFEVSNYSNIFLVPGFKLRLNTVALLHPDASTQAAGFYITNNQEPDFAVTLSASATNYVEVDLTTVSGTPDIRAFWDPGANGGEGGEFTDTVDTVIDLELNVTSNVSGFTAGKIPLYKVVTNSSGVVTSLTDCRPMFYRLGTGGNTPDPFASYAWANLPDAGHARQEGAVTVTTATSSNAPFQGGDKNIKTLKEWMDAIMMMIREIKGTPYWYTQVGGSGGGSPLINSYQNSAMTILLGGSMKQLGTTRIVKTVGTNTLSVDIGSTFDPGPSSFTWNTSTYTYTSYSSVTGVFTGVSPNPSGTILPGDAIRQGPYGHLQLIDGTTLYRMGRTYNNSIGALADVDLSPIDQRVLFIIMPNGDANAIHGYGDDGATPVKPKAITAVSPVDITVATGGNYNTAGGTVIVRGIEFTYTSYVSGTGLFTGVSPDPSGIAQIGDDVYQAPQSGVGYLHYSSREKVPGQTGSISEGAERVFWLAVYDGVSTIRTRDGALQPGETIQVGNNDTTNIIQYIGSTGPSDNYPIYNVQSIPNGTDLTTAIKTAFQIIETPIYDETVTVPINDVALYWPLSTPNDGPILDAANKAFSQGFTPTATKPLTMIKFKGREIGSPDAYYVCEIRTDAGGLPSGTVLATSGLFQAGTLGVSYGDVQFYFDTPPTLTNGTLYHAVVKVYSVNTLDASNHTIFGVGTSNPYSGGQAADSVDTGSTFLANTWDLYFYGQDATGLVAGSITALPINSKTSQPETYTIASDALVVYVDGVLMEPGQDYTEITSTSIQWIKPVVAGGRIRLRIGNIGGATNNVVSTSLQAAYNNGRTITVVTGQPVVIGGASGKLLHIQGDMEVDGVIDPKGVQFTTESTDPFEPGQNGIYYDATLGFRFRKADNTYVNVQSVAEQVGGNSQNFQRTMLNNSGVTIGAKKAVYISSAGQIAMADSTGATTSRFFGITANSIANGASGAVIYVGTVANFFGSPQSGYVWLDTVAGEVTLTPPTSNNEAQLIIGIADGLDLILQPHLEGMLV